MTVRVSLVSLLSMLALACGSQRPAADAGSLAGTVGTDLGATSEAAIAAREAEAHAPQGPKLEVMTRNLYLGGNVVAITQIDPDDPNYAELVVQFATEFWAEVQANDFPARAKVLANEIFWARPEVLALQEVATYRTTDWAKGQTPGVCAGSALPSDPQAAFVELDYLGILLAELRHRGMQYDVAARVTTADVELCMLADVPGGLTDLRYTDHDVILVRKDVKWRAATLPDPLPVPLSTLPGDANGARYSDEYTACFALGGGSVCSYCGWTSVEVHKGHRWVRVFETHLEDQLVGLVDPASIVQLAQASELVGVLGGAYETAPLPTILLGDFNVYVPPMDAAQDMMTYGFLVGGPFPLQDAWWTVHPGDPGYTWGSEDLGAGFTLDTRLDLVLSTPDLRPLFTYLVGTRDTTPGGLHPSDHAGIVTAFAVP